MSDQTQPSPRYAAGRPAGARVGCAGVSREHGESAVATAPVRGGGWVLVEHPGPWPAFGLPADIPDSVAELTGRLLARQIRPQLIRRVHDRRRQGPWQVYVGWARGGPDEVWMESRQVADLTELAELDLDALAAGRRPHFGTPHHGPVLLVCTHGRRDVCCARLGRPAAVALTHHFGDRVWETTHVGGDRFAANIVALPAGTYHGKVSAVDAVRVGQACLDGAVLLDHYRGRAGSSQPVQAAESFARRATGESRVHAVTVLDQRAVPTVSAAECARYVVDLELAGEPLRVVVAETVAEVARVTSCSDEGVPSNPRQFELVSIAQLTRA